MTEQSFGNMSQDEALARLGIAPTIPTPLVAALGAMSWTGNALEVLRVNATEDGWEFTAAAALAEPPIAAGTTSQYWRGDKSWQALTAAAVANAPAGSIAATTVQAAINELDSEKQPLDATLSALAAMAWSAGVQVPTLTAADTVTLKTVGASAGNILDKAAGDSLYQPLDSDLTTLASLTATTDNFIVSVGSAWASRTPAQVRNTLGLVIGTDVQAFDADLSTWAGVTPGTGVTTALAVNVGSAGAFVTFNGAGGTPSSLTLTNATGLPIAGLVASTTQAIGVGSIELGHVSDTTFTRVSAGVAAIEGDTIDTLARDTTATGKKQFDGGLRVTGTGSGFGGTGAGMEIDYTGGRAYLTAYDRGLGSWLPMTIRGASIALQVNGGLPGDYANDAAAAAGGVAVGDIYRNGSLLMIRVA